jgi:signal transduction histidine kinase/putative methionine-R-sulfoxide reductase with GAF domain
VNENARDLLTQGRTRALAIIPLTQAEHRVGVIIFGWDGPHEFSEQEVEVYRALTGLASPAVASRRLMDSLERMVSERTEQISTASDIAGQVNAILDPDQLLHEVVAQLHERFGLYHVHVYLLNEPMHELLMQADPSEVSRIMGQRQLIMRAGSGEVGQALLEQRHSIPLNREKSLVARAARTRKMVSVADTSLEPGFMSNPLLPETRSEVSVPLVAGDQVLGVLDLQDNRPDRFTQSDLDVFSTLAGQVSTALQNAGYVEQVEARLRVSQALAGAQTEDEVLDVMGRVAGFYPQARVTIYTVDPEAEEYAIILRRDEAFESGISSIELGTCFTAVQYPLLKYVETNNIFISQNLSLDERVDPATRELIEQVGYTSVVFFPIVARGEQLGLVVATAKEEGFFDERRLRLYQSLAEQGAIALYAARLYEETQKVAERLHEVNQIKSEFMADMSHELRTPLNSIIGYAELMLMGISDTDPDTLEDVQAIYDNGRHLLKIINDVLDLSKIEAGRMELNIEEVFVEPLLEELKTTNAGLLVNKPVEMLVEVEEDLPSIEADRVRISQVVNNLVGNAIKFTEQGSITLRGYAKGEGWICLEVQDTGVGLDEDDLQEIFERYRQVGDVGARAKGTGLGLSITRHLVQMHGGEVDVRSKLDEGSTFTVCLPVKHPGDNVDARG